MLMIEIRPGFALSTPGHQTSLDKLVEGRVDTNLSAKAHYRPSREQPISGGRSCLQLKLACLRQMEVLRRRGTSHRW